MNRPHFLGVDKDVALTTRGFWNVKRGIPFEFLVIKVQSLAIRRKKTRCAGTDPERLSRTLCIGLPTAKQTLEATTQCGLRTSNYPHGMNGRRLRLMGLINYINMTISTISK